MVFLKFRSVQWLRAFPQRTADVNMVIEHGGRFKPSE
jgi:hypothetical protein